MREREEDPTNKAVVTGTQGCKRELHSWALLPPTRSEKHDRQRARQWAQRGETGQELWASEDMCMSGERAVSVKGQALSMGCQKVVLSRMRRAAARPIGVSDDGDECMRVPWW